MKIQDKIKELNELAGIVKELKSRGKKVVLCHGVFDLLHIGHIRYFKQARKMGHVLVVTLSPDKYVDKGPHRPAFDQSLRAEGLASLDCVNYVAVNLWPTAVETLRLLKPDVYVKGAEFKGVDTDPTGKMALEAAVVEEIGGELRFTEDIVFSSTNLINRYLSGFSSEIREYLNIFRSRWKVEDMIDLFERMEKLRVLVVGDAILDEYHYCQAMGKSSKDPILAMRFESEDVFAGGVMATANHAAGFAGQVRMLTLLGANGAKEEFIRSQLRPNVEPLFFRRESGPTLAKRRFIDGYSMNKVLEIYFMDDSTPSGEVERGMRQGIEREARECDLVIVSDFGHGTISPGMTRTLAAESRFLAVNTQANAGNRGFNTITKYPRMDYGCLAEHEIRLERRDQDGPLRPMMESLVKSLGCRTFMVTRGRLGCAVAGADGTFVKTPSFTTSVSDRVGAGDAFFALTAMGACLGVDPELLGFLGNIMGSLAVNIVGNKKSITRRDAQKFATSLLK